MQDDGSLYGGECDISTLVPPAGSPVGSGNFSLRAGWMVFIWELFFILILCFTHLSCVYVFDTPKRKKNKKLF